MKDRTARVIHKGSAHKPETIREERGCPNRDFLKKFPSARIMVSGTKKFVARDRNGNDPRGVTSWVKISGEFYSAERAWADAASREGL